MREKRERQAAIDALKGTNEYKDTLKSKLSETDRRLHDSRYPETYVTVDESYTNVSDYDSRRQTMRMVAEDVADAYRQQGFDVEVRDNSNTSYTSGRTGFNGGGYPGSGTYKVNIGLSIRSEGEEDG